MINLTEKRKKYEIELKENTLKSQKKILLYWGIFILVYGFILVLLDFYFNKEFNQKNMVLLTSSLILLIYYCILNTYSKKMLRYSFIIAYLNIIFIMLGIHIYYYFYDIESFVIYICIFLSLSISINDSLFKFSLIIFSFILFDSIKAMMLIDNLYSYEIQLYILDNIIIFFTSSAINYFILYMKLEEIEVKSEILRLKDTDHLTNLLNRRGAERFVQNYVATDDLCAMIILDLDNFKLLNDTLGHSKGDECLIIISKIIKETFRHTDCVSRLGGDEFMIFMPQLLNEDCAIIKCKDILKKLPIKYKYLDQDILITSSIGISFSRKSCNDLYEKLYKEADIAMYLAKKNGKNRVEIYKK